MRFAARVCGRADTRFDCGMYPLHLKRLTYGCSTEHYAIVSELRVVKTEVQMIRERGWAHERDNGRKRTGGFSEGQARWGEVFEDASFDAS
jgi:hypothetical protein